MANEKYTVYMGTEKFRPAEGYFAIGETDLMFVDEFNTVVIDNTYEVYISPWVYNTDPQDVFEDLIPYIYAYPVDPSLDIAILFKLTNGYIYEGGCTNWSDRGMPEKTVNAYIEDSGRLYPYDSVEYIKIYILEDYDLQNQGGWTEEELDDYSRKYIQLYVVRKGDRYIWSQTAP